MTSGNVKLLGSGDVYPRGDAWPLFTRAVNFGQTPTEHWRAGADELSWTGWASYTGFGTPGSISRTNSKLAVANSTATRAFYYRAYNNAQTTISAAVAVSLANEVGLMVDDGVDAGSLGANNFVRFFLEWPTATSNANLACEYRTGGGLPTKATYLSLPPQNIVGITLTYGVGTRWGSWSPIVGVVGTGGILASITAPVSGLGWTPARHGLYAYLTNNLNRISAWDWAGGSI